ncbi:MAG: hypothetical protein K2Q97_16660 [Burkholderiaceae bacterium]|nr:hypothetical protein [Burkholderiaceae bacterium]
MTHQPRALLLLMAMLWQAVAWLSPVYIEQQKEAIAHMVVHAQEADHHHHADQTLQVDDEGSGVPHHHANQAAQVPGLPPAMVFGAGDALPSIWVPSAGTGPAQVFLEGFLRPPRHSVAWA